VLRLLAALAAPSWSSDDRVIRIAARVQDGALRLEGTTRPLGVDPRRWRAISAPNRHPGASPTSAAKAAARAPFEEAARAASDAGVDEAVLFDAADFAVEGARTNLIVAAADGTLRTPPLARGAQAGIARELLLERVPELREGDVSRAELGTAVEILAANAVRGVRAIARLDGRSVGNGVPGEWAERLARAFARP